MLRRDHIRSFLPALYPVGLLLALAPFADVLGAIWPFRAGDIAWRFGAIGLELRAVVPEVAGIALVMAVATVLGHRRVLRTAACVALLAAVGLSAAVTRFILDYRQIGSAVGNLAASGVDVSAFRAVLAAVLAVPVLTSLGGRGFVAARHIEDQPRTEPFVRADHVIPFPGRRAYDPRPRHRM
jgi:hypothetical protein